MPSASWLSQCRQSRRSIRPIGVLITGIGGTGVITVGALLGMAAHLEGRGCTVLDFTGLAQKNGAVMSHVRLAASPADLASVRIAAGGADLLLGCDMVVAASAQALSKLEDGVSRAIVNSALVPTADFVTNGDIDFEQHGIHRALRRAVGEANLDLLDGTRLATGLMGDSIATNLFMFGYAFQKGLIPLSFEAIDRAIELNGGGVAANRQTFAWGRLAAHDRQTVETAAGFRAAVDAGSRTIDDIVETNAAFLARYQNEAYARDYRARVARVSAAERRVRPGETALAEAAATSLFKLMAYKDEYEVARLYTESYFSERLHAQFEGDFKLSFHLAPPLFARRNPVTGHLRKRAYGPWMMRAFGVLATMKRVRGTALDVFGYTDERRLERSLIDDYRALLDLIVARLTPVNHAAAVDLAALAQSIRGFGHVKMRNLETVRAQEPKLRAAFDQAVALSVAAE